ncbi:hypothetical protein LB559_04490 [Mesorhizobium sp. BR1-1-3]|uniref:hypothetical protein n=1 Tax=Mesorhizobium sp. BR1-1-3 TaxID=2876651 RepID=UPI001CD06334|nr:hypothetical protein [Mesorhizobium sp. BR1-1-3]MBZ9887203.1 hypothetical protein [Mesorhizobium sp. BR1-1-3]
MLVEQYVESRKRRHDVISTSTAEAAIREVLPNWQISGRAFDDMIAASAIAHGLGVRFDRSIPTESPG